MGIEYLTVVVCERCGKESRYTPDEREWQSAWALVFPPTATRFRTCPPWGLSSVVCRNCLTDLERKQVTETELASQIEEQPF